MPRDLRLFLQPMLAKKCPMRVHGGVGALFPVSTTGEILYWNSNETIQQANSRSGWAERPTLRLAC